MMSKSSLAKLCLLNLILVTCMLLFDCHPVEESYDVKDSNYAQTEFATSPVHNNLMKKIDGGGDGKWVIHVVYDKNLNYTEPQMLSAIINNYKHTIDVNIQDSTGMTPLHRAVVQGQDAEIETIITELLNHHNINIDIANNEGKTSYDLAMDYNDRIANLEEKEAAVLIPFGNDILDRLKPKQ